MKENIKKEKKKKENKKRDMGVKLLILLINLLLIANAIMLSNDVLSPFYILGIMFGGTLVLSICIELLEKKPKVEH